MERRPEPHRGDDELAIVGKGENDHFEKLAIAASTDDQHFRRIGIGVHVRDNQRMLDGMDHLVRAMPCRPAER